MQLLLALRLAIEFPVDDPRLDQTMRELAKLYGHPEWLSKMAPLYAEWRVSQLDELPQTPASAMACPGSYVAILNSYAALLKLSGHEAGMTEIRGRANSLCPQTTSRRANAPAPVSQTIMDLAAGFGIGSSTEQGPAKSLWRDYMIGARVSSDHGLESGAEKQLLAALRWAIAFGPEDPRLAATLRELAMLYGHAEKMPRSPAFYTQWLKVAETEPTQTDLASVCARDVSLGMRNYIALLRLAGLTREAEELDDRQEPLCGEITSTSVMVASPQNPAAGATGDPVDAKQWRHYMTGASLSAQHGLDRSAEMQLLAALGIAKGFVAEDLRLHGTINQLALVYGHQSMFGEIARHYAPWLKRARADSSQAADPGGFCLEKVRPNLISYSSLLRVAGFQAEATAMAGRADTFCLDNQ